MAGFFYVNYKSITKSNILSFGWVVDIKIWFKRWDVDDDLLDLYGDARKYVVIDERLMEPLNQEVERC